MALSNEEKSIRKEESRLRKYNKNHKEIDGTIYKICNRCNEWLPCTEEYFYKNKLNGIDGLFPYCKKCNIKREQERMKGIDRTDYDKQRYINKPKYFKKASSTYYYNNVEKKAENRRRFQKNNPDRLREYAERRSHKKHNISSKEWELCKQYFNHRCAYCGIAIEDHWIKYKGNVQLGDFHKEHLDDEGENDLSNCVPSCKICNSEKNVEKLDEWYNKNNAKYDEERYSRIVLWIEGDWKTCKTGIKCKYIKLERRKTNDTM